MRPIKIGSEADPLEAVIAPDEVLVALSQRELKVIMSGLGTALRETIGVDASEFAKVPFGDSAPVRSVEVGVLLNQFMSSDFTTE